MLARGWAWLSATCAIFAVACAAGETDGARSEITVFAAASLAGTFSEIAAAFEFENQGTQVRLVFAGSPTLRTHLEQGARADVFASASVEQMELALDNGVISGPPALLIENSLVVVTPARQEVGVESIGDLARPGLKLVLADASVPVGAYARDMVELMSRSDQYGNAVSADILRNVVSLETSVSHVMAKVALGEADAGVVYASDVTEAFAGEVRVIAVPKEFNARAQYQIAVVRDANQPQVAAAFIEFVLSEPAMTIFRAHGFSVPGDVGGLR